MGKIEDIALFDMDGTTCNYDEALIRDYLKLMSPEEKMPKSFHDGEGYIKERIDLIRNKPGWWRDLKEYKPGFDILNIARELEFKIYILTKGPSSSTPAWAEKIQWLKQHIPDSIPTLTGNKGIVYGKILIDDYPPYLERWLENRPRGLGVMPAHEYNESFSHPNVIRYDGTNLEIVRKAMQMVKNRKSKEPLDLRNL